MKNKVKIILIIFLTMFLSIAGTALAQTLIKSSEVTYDNSKSNGSFDNVQKSLDELYQKAGYTGEEYHEEILHGADPVLSGELVPVYLADNGDVYYANSHTKWYEYATKRWANAVILVDDAYSKNKYSVGDKIDEEDIESYFVWIPRYAYKLWDLGNYTNIIEGNTLNSSNYDTSIVLGSNNSRIIDIEFGTLDYLEQKGYKKQIRDSNSGLINDPQYIKINDFLIHPAFTLGDDELNGFWIGKFETGYNQTNTGESAIKGIDSWNTIGAQVNSSESNKIVIKPNVYSWRDITLNNIFNLTFNYKSFLNSHMLKNTEWGAVAYLSHSAYGTGKQININNNSDFKTGYSASANVVQNNFPGINGNSLSDLNIEYNTAVGYLASTTGNITGVYDMAGGAWEYVAATMIEGRVTDYSDFNFDTIINEMKKGYIDAYPNSDLITYNNRILGDATGEIGPFYNYPDSDNGPRYHNSYYADGSYFIRSYELWFVRGGMFWDGILAGIFDFDRASGQKGSNFGFRLALAPQIS